MGSDVGTRFLEGLDGERLAFRHWPTAGEPIALLGIVHGIGEHIERYQTVVSACLARNIEVAGFDLRGHGRSGGRRGHVERWCLYRDDLRVFLERLSANRRDLPVFLLGHSFGALIALEYVVSGESGLSGLVVSGVPLKPSGVAGRAKVLLVKMLAGVLPLLQIKLDIAPHQLSRIERVVEWYRSDPLVQDVVTARWGKESLSAMERVRKGLSGIVLPLCIVHGGNDRVNLVEGAHELHQQVSSERKRLLLLPGGYHEPHNDIGGREFYDQVAAWICETGEATAKCA